MKNVASVTIAWLIAATFSVAKAQTFADFKKMPAEQKARIISDSLKVNLKLSPVQYDKVYTESLNSVKKMPASKEDGNRVERRQQIRVFLTEEETKLKTILTPAQYALLQDRKQRALAYYTKHMQDQKILFNVPL